MGRPHLNRGRGGTRGPRRWRPQAGGRARLQLGELIKLLRRNPDFRRLFLAAVVSLGGDWFSFVAVSGLVIAMTGRESSTAVVFAANVLPIFLLSPVAGVVADRVDRRRLMVAADLLRILPALALISVAALGQVWLAYLCVALISALSAFFAPVTSAVLPNLVDKEDLSLAQAALSGVWGSMLFVGAALGGVFTALFGREASFAIDALTFLVSAVLILRIHRSFRSGPIPQRASVLTHLGEVWHFARGRKLVRAFMVTKVGVGVGNGIVGLLPAYAAMRFGAGDQGIGLLLAARGFGALIGPFLARAVTRGDGRRQVALCGLAIVSYGAAYAFLPFANGLPATVVCVAVAHAGGGAQWVLSTYGLQLTAPDSVRGRIMSLDFGLATFAIGVSGLLAAGFAEAFGLEAASFGLAALALIYGVSWLSWTRDLWRGTEDPLHPPEVESDLLAPLQAERAE
ncbi:MAG: MFS transporter [Nitriliruptorales bacterium]